MHEHTVSPAPQRVGPVHGPGWRTTAVLIALYGLLAATHLALGWPMRQPHIFPDEMAYLGHARYLAGVGPLPNMGGTSFYHAGYSLFLAPAFSLFSEPAAAYRGAIATNALLISTLLPVLYRMLHLEFSVPAGRAAAVAFTTCLYPAFLLQSNLAWAENALIPGYAGLITAFAAVSRRPGLHRTVAVGVIASALYFIHPRALPLLPLTGVALCVLPVIGAARWRTAIAGVATICALFIATELVNEHLWTIGWSPGHAAHSVARFLGRAGSATRLVGAAVASAGQALYLAQSTLGIFLVPLVWAGFELSKHGLRAWPTYRDPSRVVTVLFVVGSSAALAGTSAIAVASGGSRADHLMYGRYNEMFLPIWIATGLLLLSRESPLRQARRWMSVLATLGALTLLVVTIRGHELFTREFVAPNIFGIYPLVRAMGHVDVLAISLVSGAILLIGMAAFHRSTALGLILIGTIFTAGALYGYGYCTAAQTWIASRDALPARIRGMGGVGHVSYDVPEPITQNMDFGQPQSARYFSTQFLLPRTRVHAFSSERGERPPEPVVISTRRWRDARALQARYVTSELGAETALWLLPSSPHYLSASERYLDVALAWRWFPGVWESGFHATEQSGRTRFRWTNGAATLVVPVNEFPAALVTDLSPSDADAGVRITVNGVELWDGAYPAGRRAFDLAACPVTDWVTIELSSDTFVPQARDPASSDRRTLGVAVREVRLASAP